MIFDCCVSVYSANTRNTSLIFDKWAEAWDNADVETMRSLMCDDAEMVMHSDNSKMNGVNA